MPYGFMSTGGNNPLFFASHHPKWSAAWRYLKITLGANIDNSFVHFFLRSTVEPRFQLKP